MPIGWRITLKGEHNDLEALATYLSTAECTIRQESGAYILTSPLLDQLTEASAVLEKAREFVSIAKAVAELSLGFTPNTEISGVARIEYDRPPTQYIMGVGGIRSAERFGIGGIIAVADAPLPNTRNALIASHFTLALTDPKVSKALRIFGSREHDWHNLNNIFEVVQSDVCGQITKAGWATQAEIDRFTQTANSVRASGDDARHGHEKIPAPKNPTLLAEAEALITRILKNWIDSK